VFSLSEYTKIDVPKPPSWFQGAASRQEGNGGEGREELGEVEEGKRGERGNGEGGRGSWGIAPSLLAG